jgi:hypothetical protein
MNPAAGPELRDIHLPPAPSWWPPAPGWWVVAAIVLAILVYLCIKVIISTRRRRLRRAVMTELDWSIDAARGDPALLAAALSAFLRRMALRVKPEAAAFTGERWIAYLDGQSRSDDFSRGIGRVLLDAPYQPQLRYDAAALVSLVKRCVRTSLEQGAARA